MSVCKVILVLVNIYPLIHGYVWPVSLSLQSLCSPTSHGQIFSCQGWTDKNLSGGNINLTVIDDTPQLTVLELDRQLKTHCEAMRKGICFYNEGNVGLNNIKIMLSIYA